MTIRRYCVPIWCALLTSIVSLASGCALTTMTVTPLPPDAIPTVTMQGKGRRVMVITPMNDQRDIKNRCGMKKNGYNMDTADVLCEAPPPASFGQLLISGLIKAGFHVVTETPNPTPNEVRIEATMQRYFVEPKVGFLTFTPEADIEITVRVTSASGLKAERRFYAKGIETSLAGFEANFQAAADTAAKMIMAEMVHAVIELLDEYPTLGMVTNDVTDSADVISWNIGVNAQ